MLTLEQHREFEAKGITVVPNFLSEDTVQNLKQAIDSLQQEPQYRFHDLRHTAATRMAERGVDPFTIAAILGHTDIKMTASYAHATTNAKRAAVVALEKASLEAEQAHFDAGTQMGHKMGQRPVLALKN